LKQQKVTILERLKNNLSTNLDNNLTDVQI